MADALHAVVSTVQAAADEAGVAFLASDIDEDGGKIILVSGVPRAQADHEGRLLRALRSIADADLPLPLQIGVNDGHVFAGTIGATHRATFTVMGDTVNLAARLMSAAPAGEVYATPGVLDRSRPVFATRALEPFSVKGKAQPVQAYAVDDEIGRRATADQEGPVRRPSRRSCSVVTEVLQRRRAGRGGRPDHRRGHRHGEEPPGGEALAVTGVSSFTVRGEPDGTTSSYRAFRDSLRALLGIERSDQATMAAQLAAAVARIDTGPGPAAPAHRRGGARRHPVDPGGRRHRAPVPPRSAGRRRHRACSIGPSTMTWPSSWRTPNGPTARPMPCSARLAVRRAAATGLVDGRAAAGGATRGSRRRAATLQLGPMEDGELRELLVALSPVPLRPDEVQRLVSRAAGSPLVLDALVRLGRERGAVDDLPDSLEALIAAEIDVLSPFPRLLLGYASVLGRSFNPLVWRQPARRRRHRDRRGRDERAEAVRGVRPERRRPGSARPSSATLRTGVCRTAVGRCCTSGPDR